MNQRRRQKILRAAYLFAGKCAARTDNERFRYRRLFHAAIRDLSFTDANAAERLGQAMALGLDCYDPPEYDPRW